MTPDEARYERNPDYIFRKIADELLLVPVRPDVADMECLYTMNPVGAFIWEKLDGQATLGDIQAGIAEEYAVDAQVAAADLLEFVHELESVGAVRRV